MAINKVEFGSRTLIDLTSDTVTADKLAEGYTAHTAAGVKVTGTMQGANTDFEDGIIDGTFSGAYTNDRVTKIRQYLFQGTEITEANFPKCSNIDYMAFEGCYSLKKVSFPMCKSISQYAFFDCMYLESANFPECTYIGSSTFESCVTMSEIDFPKLSSVAAQAFSFCQTLRKVVLPECKVIQRSAFENCWTLSYASLPKCTNIYSNAFAYCGFLVSLYLLGSSVAKLSHSNAFSSTPIGGYTFDTGGEYGSIYVPASLYNQYIAATNWTYFSSRFVSA